MIVQDRLAQPRRPELVERLARRGGGPIAAIAVLALVTVWIFHLQLFEQWSFPWDFLGTYTTTPAFVAATFGHGHPLSWTPFVASGFPVDVDAQSGIYFPVWWALGALRVPLTLQALTAVQVVHVLAGGIGALLLARARRLSWLWATVAAVAYLFFGGFYGQAEHADYFRGFSYLPWLLWALTPPDGPARWTRLGALPLVAWLLASGGYPGQVVSFGVCGAVYLAVAMRADGGAAWRRHRVALALAVAASAAICFAVMWPYIRADQAGELVRINEPTAAERAKFALAPIDLFGLYLNNFAWTSDGTVTAWAIGIPMLVGLACVRMQTLRRQAPLAACGAVALALAMTPKVGFLGKAMASVRPLFPTRFPAADYKATVALALILISVDAWSRLPTRADIRLRALRGVHPRTPRGIGRSPRSGIGPPRRRAVGRAVALAVVSCALIAGPLLVSNEYAKPTEALWLVIVVVLAAAALALIRPPAQVLAGMLLVLVVVDGARVTKDLRSAGTTSPWQVPPAELSFYQSRDVYVRELPELLARTPQARPARAPETRAPEPNASGWVADAYHEADYDTTRERGFEETQNSAALYSLLLEPWHAYMFPCSVVDCRSGHVHLPPPQTWRASANASTLAYGVHGIVYSVDVERPTLMVENELAIRGWRTNSPHVRLVDAKTPLRAWRLAPGRYRFTATFQEPGRPVQYAAVSLALLGWLASAFALARRPPAGGAREPLSQQTAVSA
jgi:hypothetical protein